MLKPNQSARGTVSADPDSVVEQVRDRYGKIASGAATGCCSQEPSSNRGPAESEVARSIGYEPEQLNAIPEEANLGLGCGAPISKLNLQPGEVVLDLGSGAGIDAFLAASQVGESGRVIGVDMTEEMIERARRSAVRAGFTQVEFRLGRLELLPVDDASVDAVTSNCVINLVPDKSRVFGEIARVLRPGGRVVISDIVLDGQLPAAVRQDLLAYVGCVAGAMQRDTYFDQVRRAGLGQVEVLHDIDYLAKMGELLPDEVLELMRRTGTDVRDLSGLVRSITFRASRS